jgi:glycosyltransferase involved in cell wall biosynthesis
LRPELEAWIRDHDAAAWATLLGHVTRGQLRDEYRRAWIVGSASLAEGWGLSLTEGAACGTPAVATDISGHRCSVVAGETGVLAPEDDLGRAIATVLGDDVLRARLGAAALARARTLTWEASARGVLEVLHGVVAARRQRRP